MDYHVHQHNITLIISLYMHTWCTNALILCAVMAHFSVVMTVYVYVVVCHMISDIFYSILHPVWLSCPQLNLDLYAHDHDQGAPLLEILCCDVCTTIRPCQTGQPCHLLQDVPWGTQAHQIPSLLHALSVQYLHFNK